MLTKLLKYEFRSIGRQLIPLYLGVLGLALVNHLFWFSDATFFDRLLNRISANSILSMIVMLAYVAICVTLFVVTCLLIIQRFYKGLLTDEGYLMFTLPCKPWQLIAAKGFAASVMIALGTVVGILSACLMALEGSDWLNFLSGFLNIPYSELFRAHAFWPLYVVEAIVLAAVSLWNTIGHVYVSIALGHLSKRHRVALAIVAYIGINIAWSVLMVTGVNLIDATGFSSWMNSLTLSAPTEIHLGLLLMIIWQLIPTAIYFFGTNWILSNKLNLE